MFRRGVVRKKLPDLAGDMVEKWDFPALQRLIRRRPIVRKVIRRLLSPKVLLPKDFYDELAKDMVEADEGEEIIIYSPFTYKPRVDEITSFIRRSRAKVVVYTRPPESFTGERKKWQERNIEALRGAGAEVHTRKGMHEKAVFIGERIAYFGSLNVLSRLDEKGGDYMLRYEGALVAPLIKEFLEEIEAG